MYYGRGDSTTNLDASVQKDFHIGERWKVQYRFDAFNATNRNQFALPSLGPTSPLFGNEHSHTAVEHTALISAGVASGVLECFRKG